MPACCVGDGALLTSNKQVCSCCSLWGHRLILGRHLCPFYMHIKLLHIHAKYSQEVQEAESLNASFMFGETQFDQDFHDMQQHVSSPAWKLISRKIKGSRL